MVGFLSAQDNILKISDQISKMGEGPGSCDFRFALVAYRDHPPQDTSFVTKVFTFTQDYAVMKKNVVSSQERTHHERWWVLLQSTLFSRDFIVQDKMSANGGGDGPEEVACAFHDVLKLPWREAATKICIFITDAPPHGLVHTGARIIIPGPLLTTPFFFSSPGSI